ncbi:Transglycosylase SLT domain-containing protein [Acinetobacter kyonggiensis]|uniref:Transglycosylase SLT domain-containing protein n=1 Tax=Acinetobacter kyonggiensis TaxID=595670 RepID=A0A1H3M2S9_9GAMM|nr:Transglycosylase SLT domain-containing protein [Acinetobacter kyonggiensis]
MFITSYLQSQLLNTHFCTFKFVTIAIIALAFTGCSSLGSGSIAKRSAKLSMGIQKAYAIEPNTANRVSPMIVQSADKYNVDPLLLAAMIRQESSYKNYAISPVGAVGLTQIIPRYWQQICSGDLIEENNNINCGTYILASYNSKAGSWPKALAYYNVGPTGYNTSHKMKKQGKKYAHQVQQHQKTLKSAL